MGRSHAASGAAAGLALAPTIGLDTLAEAVPFAVLLAGYALVPDLDAHGALCSRLLGPVTGGISRLLTWLSKRLYVVSCGPGDRHGPVHGGHRHLTHSGLFCLLLGLAAWLSSLASPWVVAAWAGFGLLAAASALGDLAALAALAGLVGLVVPVATAHTAPAAVLADMRPWLGLAVGLGCLTHLAGDMLTITGVPLLWPLAIRGQRWRALHLLPAGLRLHTGHHPHLTFGVFIALAAVAALPYLPLDTLPQLAAT